MRPFPPGASRGNSDGAPMTTPLQPGDTFTDTKGDPYRVRRKLGEGGMAIVYEVDHPRTAIRYAVKIAKLPESSTAAVRGELIRCFNREREMMQRVWHLRHPNIATLIDAGTTAVGEPYIILEYLDGETLAQHLKQHGSLPWREACNIAIQMGNALAAVHSLAIVHRDLSLRNVFLCNSRQPDGPSVKLLDFGVAKYAGQTIHPGLYGSPPYMAPEQASEHASIDERADQFALAACLIEMLTGKPPFASESEDVSQILNRVQTEDLGAVIGSLDVPSTVRASMVRALMKDPQDRFPNIEEFVEELRRAPDDDTIVPVGARALPIVISGELDHPTMAMASLPAAPFGLWFYAAIGLAVVLCGSLSVLLPRWLTPEPPPSLPVVEKQSAPDMLARPAVAAHDLAALAQVAPPPDAALPADAAVDAAVAAAVSAPPALSLAPAPLKKKKPQPRRIQPSILASLKVNVGLSGSLSNPTANAAAQKQIRLCMHQLESKLPPVGILDASRGTLSTDYAVKTDSKSIDWAMTQSLARCLKLAFLGAIAAPTAIHLTWGTR